MPATSRAQFRAMQAAKHGHSTLGIPASVGAEFVAETKTTKGMPEHKAKAMSNAMRRKRKEMT